MLSPVEILAWLEENVKGVRRSRIKTLANIVPAAMEFRGVGVLSLGRAMETNTTCKHNIERVNRLLGNEAFEGEALAKGLFDAFVPESVRALVLADWTDVPTANCSYSPCPPMAAAFPFSPRSSPRKPAKGP